MSGKFKGARGGNGPQIGRIRRIPMDYDLFYRSGPICLIRVICVPFSVVLALLVVVLAIGLPALSCSPPLAMMEPATAVASSSMVLREGPHLFLDDTLIESRRNITRQVNPPQRHRARPVIGSYFVGDGFNNGQHNVVVLYQDGLFKMWYRALGDLNSYNRWYYTTSSDGENWTAPLDETHFSDNLNDMDSQTGFMVDVDGTYRGVFMGAKKSGYSAWKGDAYSSRDGFQWMAYSGNPVVNGYYGELWQPYWDEARQRYGLLHRWNRAHSWTDLEGKYHNLSFVRCYGHTTSPTFNATWPASDLIWCPDSRDSGITEFYVTSNVIRRGETLITMLSISRDDLTASGVPATRECPAYDRTYNVYGMGYTVLAWSTDGQTWHRDRHTDKFFEPSAAADAFDHSHAWITSIVEVGDDVYLYYGGYQYGHKVYCDRSIGLVKMKRDRYVAQKAGPGGGWLRTPLVTLSAGEMTLNVNAAGGEARVQVLDANGRPVPGLSAADCQPITADSLDAPLRCARPLADVKGTPVHLEFSLRNAQLFAFTLREPRTPVPTSTPTTAPTPKATPTATTLPMPAFTPTRTPKATATPTPTPRAVESHFFSLPPALDGDLGEWAGVPAVMLDADTAEYVHPRQVPEVADASAVLRSGWDGEHLYFALEVRDDVLVADSAQIWRDDSMELGLDGLFDHLGRQADDHQFTLNVDGRVADFGRATEAVQVVTGTVDGGWAVEVAITAQGLAAGPLVAGKEIGFTFGLHDDDDGGDWDSYLIWAGSATNDSSAAYGRLWLSGPPTPTPTTTFTPTPTVTPTPTPTPTFTVTPTPTATPCTLESRFFSLPPALDGDLGEWAGLPVVVLDADTAEYVHPRQVPEVADASAVLRSGWDGEHLYFALEVRDDVLVADSAQIWRDDSMELGLDGLFDHLGWQADDHQFTINVDGRVTDFGRATEAVQVVTGTVDGGWVVEVAIAAKGLAAGPLVAGKEIGFTFGLHDDDDGGDWDSYLIWAGSATNDSSAAYGRLWLSGPPTPTPTAIATSTPTPSIAHRGRISGQVWDDRDGDGVREADEQGLVGVGISLREAGPDAIWGTEDDVVYAAQSTDEQGEYAFAGLPAGLYRLRVDTSTLPAGYVLTTANEPLDAVLDIDEDLSVDGLGYALSVAIGDYVFEDLDADGLADAGETTGIEGVVVILEDTERGLSYAQVTSDNGHYLFTALPPGRYTIAVWDVPGLFLMSDSPQTFSIGGGESDLARDFGFMRPTAVQMVWFEAIPDPHQVVLSWWMYLYGQAAPSFRVWRSLPGQSWEQVGAAPVEPVSVNGNMAAYVYTDTAVKAGQIYLYRLEGGGRTFGPWQVRVPSTDFARPGSSDPGPKREQVGR